MEWTREQSFVIDWLAGALLLVAVAGAGKTTVLLGRIKRLLERRACRPSDVLMVTFSKRGATDMAERAARLAVPAGVEYRTLHSVAFEMVRSAGHRLRLVVPKDYQLIRVVRDTLRDIERERGGRPRARGANRRTATTSDDGLPKPGQVLSLIGRAKAALIWPEAWTAKDGETFPAFYTETTDDDGHTVPGGWALDVLDLDPDLATIAGRCYQAIESAVSNPASHGFEQDEGARWITFDDMLAVTARAVLRGERRDRWVNRWGGTFKQVQVDEVQDNNRAQWVICEHLVSDADDAALVAVGDDQQSIYGFRGAQPALMRRHLDNGATLAPLSTNWRSGQGILDHANLLLDTAEDRLFEGRMVAGLDHETFRAGAEYGDTTHEANDIADQIAAAIEAGEDPDEVCCLYRLNACSAALEVALIRRGIRYRVAGSSFFALPAVRAAIGYLACALDEGDERGFSRIYNVPLRGLGRAFSRQAGSVEGVRAMQAEGELGRWRRGAVELLSAVEGVRDELHTEGVGAALRYVFEDLGVREMFREEGADAEDETEVDAAADALVSCAAAVGSAGELVEYARSMTGRSDHTGERGRTPAVTLSTIHKAKGLEWSRVFVVGMSDGLLPFVKGDPGEELRLAYVAVTRARKHLQVSWTLDHNGRAAGPSPLAELGGFVALAEGGHEAGTSAA